MKQIVMPGDSIRLQYQGAAGEKLEEEDACCE